MLSNLKKEPSYFYISEVSKIAPSEFETGLQQQVYATLEELNIDFERVQTDEAISDLFSVLLQVQTNNAGQLQTYFTTTNTLSGPEALVTAAGGTFQGTAIACATFP